MLFSQDPVTMRKSLFTVGDGSEVVLVRALLLDITWRNRLVIMSQGSTLFTVLKMPVGGRRTARAGKPPGSNVWNEIMVH